MHELIGIRSLVALGALGMLFVATGRPIPRSAAVWRVGFVFGTTAMSGGVLFTTLALEHASAGFVGVIVAVSPLVAAVTAHHVGVTERLHVGKVLGLAVSLFGVAVLLLSGDAGLGGEGNALIAAGLMAAVVALATFALFYAKRHAVGLEPLDLAFAQFTSAAVLLVSIMLIGHGLPTGVTAAGWGLTGFLGVVGQAVPFTVTYWLLQRTTVTHTTLVAYIHPLIAGVLGVILLGEEPGPGMLVGGAMILLGLFVTDSIEHRVRRNLAGIGGA